MFNTDDLICPRCLASNVYRLDIDDSNYDCGHCGRIGADLNLKLAPGAPIEFMSQAFVEEIELADKFRQHAALLRGLPHISIDSAPPAAKCDNCGASSMFDLGAGNPRPPEIDGGLWMTVTPHDPTKHQGLRLLCDYVDEFVGIHRECSE